jgi:hypothetical protein
MAKLPAYLENLDEIDDTLKGLFVETKDKDGKTWFVLDLDDTVKQHPMVAALQNAHESQKKQNRELRTELQTLKTKAEGLPDDWDPDEWTRLKELETQFNELKKDGGDPDFKARHDAEIQSQKKMYEERYEKLNKKMDTEVKKRDESIESLKGRIQKMVVQDGLTKALVEAGVKKEALPFVSAKLEKSIKVVEEDDEFRATVDTDMGPLPLDQFIEKWSQSDEAKMFVEQAKGSGAEGTHGKGGTRTDESTNPWSKTGWDMRRQAHIIAQDASRADRMAKAAGHKKARGALLLDAK